MEGNDWYNTGYTGYRNHYRGDDRPIDQDVFRGSYRFDNNSPHHNETTYDGFDRRGERHESSRTYDRMPDRNNGGQSFYYNDTRSQDRNRGRRPQGYWYDEELQRPEGSYRSSHISGNFDAYYGRDPYNEHRSNENYGNMAGTLSYGYDGDYNANWDEYRHYNPLTGHRRSYHGNYTSRHPEPGREYINRDSDRDRDRNRNNDYNDYGRHS